MALASALALAAPGVPHAGAAGAAPAVGAASVMQPPAPAAPARTVLDRQAAAQAVIDAWGAEGRSADRRFAGLVVDPEHALVRIYRVPAPAGSSGRVSAGAGSAEPAERARRTERAEQAARRLSSGLRRAGLRVLDLPAAFSRRDLTAAQDRLAGSPVFAARGVQSVAVADDGSGLVVRAPHPDAGLLRDLRSAVTATVTLRAADLRPATRWSDSAPFYGGGGTEHPKGSDWCSTGFAVRDAQGHGYLATAAHCDRTGGPAWYSGDGRRRIGAMTWDGSTRGVDIGLVPARVAGYVFDGAWDDRSGYHKPVAGWSGVSSGMLLCASGAWSGAVCDIRVSEVDATMRVHGHVVHGAWVEHRHGRALWGPGDSGGPVFALTPDNDADLAVGVVSALDGTRRAACQGRTERARGGACASAGMIAPMSRLRDAAAVVVLTAP